MHRTMVDQAETIIHKFLYFDVLDGFRKDKHIEQGIEIRVWLELHTSFERTS